MQMMYGIRFYLKKMHMFAQTLIVFKCAEQSCFVINGYRKFPFWDSLESIVIFTGKIKDLY